MPAFPPTRLYTVEDVWAIPDDFNRYEVIAGELFVTPSPSRQHQAVLRELVLRIGDYVKRYQLGEMWFAPLDVVLGPMTLVEPDLLFVRTAHADRLTERDVRGAPDLAVEVLSPSTARTDRGRKRALYQEIGVEEYWVVDLDLRQIEVWRPGAREAEVCREHVRWQPDPAVAPLSIDLPELFRAAR